ncbi:hypothetical protein BV394_13300 [Brevirhabdus pacifica]|uniref:Uncharacterized protein n=1 Tax=Brevirhabdus pacifica TaxID=1267768 RepID=A0A1U7DKS6_9RHOB|nr:DUF427 domain-containing protein [Brevirhabdus pacifica]APX90572.1 hypothetical protein BV394_13300 [Brevirhabdus pacifica]OWU78430.1 hypothetical protein ATO5_06165 [Loktanella sp. 22II-4b]PJJ85296.1 uncharacterized protein (DUF427 family) [Brevirhabdus pacifica]
MENVSVHKASGKWVVRAGGAVIGESKNALELVEGDYPPVIYFPREDIAMAFLDPSDTRTTCPRKGEAKYFSIQTKSALIKDAAWSYEEPLDQVSPIKGHLAFYKSDKIAVEQL